jgi:hypothetical protein
MAQPLVYRLGLEEVIFLQRVMRLETLPGVNLSRFQSLDADHQTLALAVADRSLRARNLVQRLQGLEREVNAEVVGTFSEYAHAELLCELTLLSVPSAAPITYAINSRFAVEHIECDADIHQFTTMYADEAVLAAVERFLPRDVPSGQGMEITSDLGPSLSGDQILPSLRSWAARQSSQVVLHQSMREAIASPQWSMQFTLRTSGRVITVFTFFQGATGLYCLAMRDGQWIISPISGGAARDKALAAIRPYISERPIQP